MDYAVSVTLESGRYKSWNIQRNDTADKQKKVAEFVKAKLKQRICSTFIPEEDSESKQCQCGRPRDLHTKVALQKESPESKWDAHDHSYQEACKSFGEISFVGYGKAETRSPYARIDYKTDADIIWPLLTDIWSLSPPRLAISVAGGAQPFNLKTRLKKAFKQGLIRIAHSTGAWIITRGTATGVMKHVGEAVREGGYYDIRNPNRRMVAIGVVPWGIVDNSQSLVGSDESGMFPALYNLRECINESKAPLDHNHTHFLLVDDGSDGKYGVEIPIRSSLEEVISRQTHSAMTSEFPVSTPVVLLLVEGSPNSFETARSAMSLGVPVVVLDESGRAADVVAKAYSKTEQRKGKQEYSVFPSDFDEKMTKIVAEKFDLNPETKKDSEIISKAIESLREMLKKREMITLFSLDDEYTKELDKAILYALLKSKKSDLVTQVDLALIWNRSDIATDLIFVPENRTRLKELQLDKALHTVLLKNEVEFVKLFLENGLELQEFLTQGKLRDLYTAGLEKEKEQHMNTVIRNIFYETVHTANCCQWTCPRGCTMPISHDEQSLYNIGVMVELLLNEQLDNIYKDTPKRMMLEGWKSFENPERDLFLWAIIFAKFEIAEFMWKCIPNPVGGALIASLLLRYICKEAKQYEEVSLSEKLQQESWRYEQRACGVLRKCYEINKSASLSLLTRELAKWGHCSAFMLAGNNGKTMDFMSLGASQAKLNRIWLGRMSELIDDWQVFVTTICPFLIFPLIRFKASEFPKAKNYKPPPPVEVEDTKGSKNRKTRSGLKSENSKDGPLLARLATRVYGFPEPQGKLYKASICSGSNGIGIFPALYYFYTAPAAKFTTHAISHLVFLGIFTCVTLTELQPFGEFDKPTAILEAFVWFWAGTLLLDEVRQLLCSEAKSLRVKIYVYFCSFWNALDFFLSLLLIATIIVRVCSDEHDKTVPRITYAILLMFWYLRFMSYLFLWKSIGPKIFMIRQMIRDLLFFMCILLIFLLSFGIPMQALLHPSRKFSWEVIIDAIYAPYFNIFGELMLDRYQGKTFDGRDCTTNATVALLDKTMELCPKKAWLVPFMFAIYIMLTNVLLLNLLIAMFSYTFQQVQDNSDKVWRYYRYHLVEEAYSKPAIPPPFILLAHIFQVLAYFWRKCCGSKTKSTNDFKKSVDEELNLKLNHLESIGRDQYLAAVLEKESQRTETQLSDVIERLDVLWGMVDDLHTQTKQLGHMQKQLASITRSNNKGPVLQGTEVIPK